MIVAFPGLFARMVVSFEFVALKLTTFSLLVFHSTVGELPVLDSTFSTVAFSVALSDTLSVQEAGSILTVGAGIEIANVAVFGGKTSDFIE